MRLVLAAFLALSAAFVSAGDAARPRVAGEIVFASERGSTLDNSDYIGVYAQERVYYPDLSVEEGIRIFLTGGMSLPGRIEGKS